MVKQFLIQGAVVDTEMERTTVEDVCPQMFSDFAQTLQDGDDVEILINSVGGSVTAGISIANMIKRLADNHNTTAVILGLAASIASVIACSCKTVKMYDSSFMMIHNCWGIVQGNSNDLRREADVMEMMNKAIMSFYKGKFSLEESEIKILMDNETWFSGSEAKSFCFNCELLGNMSDFKIAAKLTNFKNVPKALNMNKNEEEIKKEEETTETVEETKDETSEEKPVEETEEKTEEVKEETEEKEDECEEKTEEDEIESKIQARVSGMQSTMQNKINVLTKDFQNQLQAKDAELSRVNDELISLKQKLEETEKELSEKVSAFEEKNNALAQLNANVLADKVQSNQVDWHNLKGKEFFDYLKQNKVR